MPQIPIPVVGGEYESRSRPISAQRAVNCFPEVGRDAQHQAALTGAPGTILSASNGPVRGMLSAGGSRYYVAGSTLYKDDTAITGTIIDDGQPVDLLWNTDEILVTAGGKAHIHQRNSSTVALATDTDFPTIQRAAFLDGYAVITELGAGRVWVTTNNDFETISGADFATGEGLPDNNVSLQVDHREVWLFQAESTELWYNQSAGAAFPLARAPNGFIERGCAAVWGTAKLDNTVYWLGDDLTVYKAEGLQPIRVSNHGIEKIIEDAPDASAAIASSYTQQGHAFFQLHFPGHATVLYDASTDRWHTRRAYGQEASDYWFYLLHNRVQYSGGAAVYTLDLDNFQHNGGTHERIKAIGPMDTDGRFVVINNLSVQMEMGNTPTNTQKKVFLRISKDSGETWSERIEASIGTRGKRAGLVEFRALGGYWDPVVFELSVTDNASFNVIKAWADVS